ncbi:MAG: hypothetical protein QOJ50_1023 [Cryptosporangiaceae bacterium]|nr:hypothetical protein [Cryptosporangiaceae bacterium]
MNRRQSLATMAVLVTATLAATAAALPATGSASGASSGRYEIGLFGDMPYGDYGRAHYPAVIADLNAHHLAFSVFDGDLKNGSEPCYADVDGSAQAAGKPDVYKYALGYFQQLRAASVVVPGDNEWTDCDRAKISPHFDANDRLAYERTLFYPTDRSLGRHPIRLTRQSPAYPENVRWANGPVTYIGLNIPGSDNNWIDPARDGTKEGPADEAQAEYTARNRANLDWLDQSFAAATAAGSKAVMIVIQADMWDPSAAAKGTLAHYADTKVALARHAIAFGKPIVLVNGDSHSFELDKPLTDAAPVNAAGDPSPNVIENFTRVTTFGEFQNHWVSAIVDPADPDVFTFHQHLIPANVPVYTPPA